MKRDERFVPTRLTERVGQAIGRIGKEFTIFGICRQCPDLPYQRIRHLMEYKMDMGVIEQISHARFRVIREPFAMRSPTGVISEAVWQVLREHRRRPLSMPKIVQECAAKLDTRRDPSKAISMILSIWRRRGVLVRGGVHNARRYQLAAEITRRPLTTTRGLD